MEVAMATYFLINLPFLLFVLALDTLILKTFVVRQRKTWLIMLTLLLLTLIFDQPLTQFIYGHDASKSLLHIGSMPIEDLGYTIAVVIGMGSLLRHETRN
jgi:lycopene cyclase domain-containing protein